MEVQEIIDKWKLNRALLASKLGMPKGTFNNKLSPKHPTKFSDEEMICLKMVLREMCTDVDTVTDIDFNDALKSIVK